MRTLTRGHEDDIDEDDEIDPEELGGPFDVSETSFVSILCLGNSMTECYTCILGLIDHSCSGSTSGLGLISAAFYCARFIRVVFSEESIRIEVDSWEV